MEDRISIIIRVRAIEAVRLDEDNKRNRYGASRRRSERKGLNAVPKSLNSVSNEVVRYGTFQ